MMAKYGEKEFNQVMEEKADSYLQGQQSDTDNPRKAMLDFLKQKKDTHQEPAK